MEAIIQNKTVNRQYGRRKNERVRNSGGKQHIKEKHEKEENKKKERNRENDIP